MAAPGIIYRSIHLYFLLSRLRSPDSAVADVPPAAGGGVTSLAFSPRGSTQPPPYREPEASASGTGTPAYSGVHSAGRNLRSSLGSRIHWTGKGCRRGLVYMGRQAGGAKRGTGVRAGLHGREGGKGGVNTACHPIMPITARRCNQRAFGDL